MTWDEGGICPKCNEGILEIERPYACSCHLHPPCSACLESYLVCNKCGYTEEEDSNDTHSA